MERSTGGGLAMAEPISVTLGIIASLLRIAASVKDLVRKGGSEQGAVQDFLKTATQKERALLKTDGMEDAVIEISTIAIPLLEQFAKEAQGCEKAHIAARRKATMQVAKDLADTKAAECMCNILRGIYKHNAMKLPQSFQDWWSSYNCTL
jgi:hypothetical protein